MRISPTKHMQEQQWEREAKGERSSKCWAGPCGWGSPGIITEAFKPPLQWVNLRVTRRRLVKLLGGGRWGGICIVSSQGIPDAPHFTGMKQIRDTGVTQISGMNMQINSLLRAQG